MDLAVQTTASPGAIWTIVVVAVVLLAFWLFMVMVYAARPDPRFRQVPGMAGPALGGDARADLGAAPETQVPAQRGPQAPAPVAGAVEAQAEPIPAQRTTPADAPQPANAEDGPPTA